MRRKSYMYIDSKCFRQFYVRTYYIWENGGNELVTSINCYQKYTNCAQLIFIHTYVSSDSFTCLHCATDECISDMSAYINCLKNRAHSMHMFLS